MAKEKLINNVISATKALKGSKLGTISTIEPTMETIMQLTGLETMEEVMVFVAIFDRQCTDTKSTLWDLADYFACSAMEAMTLAPALESLQEKGFLHTINKEEKDVKKKGFSIPTDVFNAIVNGNEIHPVPQNTDHTLDQHEFCRAIHDLVKERKDEDISTKELFAKSEQLEMMNPDLLLVKALKEQSLDIDARVWFYEMCRDFSLKFRGCSTGLNCTLSDFYDRISEGTAVKKCILDGSHPLIKAELIHVLGYNGNVNDIELRLTDKGIRLLFGDAAEAYVRSDKCVNKYDFLSRVEDLFDPFPHRGPRSFRNMFSEFQNIEKSNVHFSAVENVMKLIDDDNDRLLYYRICKKLIDSESFRLGEISDTYPSYMEMGVKRQFKDKQHVLQKQGLVEIQGNGFYDGAALTLTDKGKELFFEEDIDLFEEKISDDDLVDSATITEKKLFFEPVLEEQLSALQHSLEETKLTAIRERLKANNLPTGVAALLYGHPGTGKTESVMQIARATGRSIMHVDISQTKSHWFGQSEKIIKGVFNKYRKLCKRSKVKPILLFNEADAVFSKRKDVNSSNVAQTENAIQNIILEELETLDGILIATTNMASNLDSAFERRFLFKVRFDKPTIDSKVHIWKDKMPHLTDEEAMKLASHFDFSGGEIDNIVRKATMEEVVSGVAPTLERLIILCGEEKISTEGRKMGFQ